VKCDDRHRAVTSNMTNDGEEEEEESTTTTTSAAAASATTLTPLQGGQILHVV